MASPSHTNEHGERQKVTRAGKTVAETDPVGIDLTGEPPSDYPEQCSVETAMEVANSGFSLERDFTLQPHRDEQDNIINPNFVFRPDVLCSNCNVWAQNFRTARDNNIPVHSSLTHLWQCARDGCHMCLYIGHKLDYWTRKHAPFVSITLNIWDTSKKKYLGTPMQVLPESHRFEGLTTRKLPTLLQWYNEPIVGCLDHFTASNAADVYIQEASQQLKECLSSHTRCQEFQISVSPPTRLMKVGTRRLHIIYPTERVEYAAVSHCWGSSRSILLTKSNHDQLVIGFDEEQLPRLFRDCVTVARRMDIEYLWIDSLCIMQDSRDDWEHEARRMGDVYCGSLFTISAAAATGCLDSLFTKYHPLALRPYTMQNNRKDQALGFMSLVNIPSPLYDRAWVLQEILLSTRILAYTNSGVSWRCQTENLESSQGHEDRALLSFREFSFVQDWNELIRYDKDCTLSPAVAIEKAQSWMAVMNKYLSMKLSYETDRPYAMKGILTHLEQRAGLRIVAETCAQFLPYSLLWYFGTSSTDVTLWDYATWRSSLAQSPSWSSSFRRSTRYLRPKCPLKIERPHQPRKIEIHESSTGPTLHLACSYHGLTQVINTPILVTLRDLASLKLRVYWDFKTEHSVQVCYVLLGWGTEAASTYGLVLTRDLHENDTWERVGIFQAVGSRSISESDIGSMFDKVGEFLVS